MLDYMKVFCQIKKSFQLILICQSVIFLISCQAPKKIRFSQKVQAVPQWLNVNKKNIDKDDDFRIFAHPFFDLLPFSSVRGSSVNFVLTTPEGSDRAYGFDLYSGKFYTRFWYCDQKDVWKSTDGIVNRPPYTTGFVPRLLDSLGAPQKIIVFGNAKIYQKYVGNLKNSHRVRVIGGLIQQHCDNFPCYSREKWSSRLVLVAVDPSHYNYSKVFNFYDLKKRVDWEHVKTFLQNGEGRSLEQGKERPYIRIIDEIEGRESLKYAIEKGHLFKYDSMMSMRDGCHELYDYLWNAVLRIKAITKKLNDKKWFEEKVKKDLREEKRRTKIVTKQLKKARIKLLQRQLISLSKRTFVDFFIDFYDNFSDRFRTCSKYVSASNIKNDLKRHWFFAYLQAFFHAEELGYVYMCNKNHWFENYLTGSGHWVLNTRDELMKCSSEELQEAFGKTGRLFRMLMNQRGINYYRYITYDYHDGTHQKLYSWIKVSGKALSCKTKPASIWRTLSRSLDERPIIDKKFNENYIFPNDISWEKFITPTDLSGNIIL